MKTELSPAHIIDYDFALTGRGKMPYDAQTRLKGAAADETSTHVFRGVAYLEGAETEATRGNVPPKWTAYFKISPDFE